MSTTFHVALSVDIDRFSDAKLSREFAPMFRPLFEGREPTPQEIRDACASARAKGLSVFRPCDKTKPDGSCAGHAARGFAAMDPEKRRAICSAGGKAAQAKPGARRWTTETAREAGKLGGAASGNGRRKQVRP